MTLVLNGTNGLSDVDGSASTPAIRGTDANTGIFFPAADTIAFSEGGTEAMRIDSSGNVGIGTSSPATKLDVGGTIQALQVFQSSSGTDAVLNANGANRDVIFKVNNTELARLVGSGGNLLVGTTSGGERLSVAAAQDCASFKNTGGTGKVYFLNSSASTIGSITWTGSTTTYATSSDYRLKNTVEPMTGALERIAALKPVTYKWNIDDSNSEGFIAHELAEVCPQAVVGEKDAVDAEGNPQYQGIDTSFLVATLTAAIQELKALVDTQASTITTLTDRITALEAKP
jgi:hypothetical protein